jgi:hypothetical protein
MLIQSVIKPRILDEFDLMFSSGILLPITIDKDAGDTVDMSNADYAIFNITAKPASNNPDTLLPAEEITVFLRHVISVTHRVREILPANPDQVEEFKSLFKLPDRLQ